MQVNRPLPEASVQFRGRIIDALLRVNRSGFWYIDADTCAGSCPICGDVLGVYFHGYAPRADLVCRGGCTEPEVANAIGGEALRVQT